MHRIHALTNTFSGVAGEARVAAELVRCGFLVAKPYWTDDEADLIVLDRRHSQTYSVVPVVIQVKSVQFLPNKQQQTRSRAFIQGLRKRYVLNSPAFALAIYRVDLDEMFFIHGQDNVRSVYEAQCSWNRKHIPFDSLKGDDDVRIAVHLTDGIPGDWRIPRLKAAWLSNRIHGMVETVMGDQRIADEAVQGLWKTLPPSEDTDEDVDEYDRQDTVSFESN
jgi:hypothetical protein